MKQIMKNYSIRFDEEDIEYLKLAFPNTRFTTVIRKIIVKYVKTLKEQENQNV